MNLIEKDVWSVDPKGNWSDGKLEEWQRIFSWIPSFY